MSRPDGNRHLFAASLPESSVPHAESPHCPHQVHFGASFHINDIGVHDQFGLTIALFNRQQARVSVESSESATSPSFMCDTSILTMPLHSGPSIRWLMVLGALYRLSTTREVVSLKCPGRSVSDHASLTGQWFHRQFILSLSELKSSLVTIFLSGHPATGRSITAGIFPFSSPSIGQPSIQRHGIKVSTRPTPPRS